MQTEPTANSAPLPGPRLRFDWKILVGAGVFIAIAAAFISLHGRADVPSAAHQPPAVAVAKAVRRNLFNLVTLPASLRPYLEIELHAEVSGYLKEINVDIGDRVKAGQLLAVLDAPDLVFQLNSARAAEQKAAAAATNAHLILGRLESVFHRNTNLVSQQELDTADANDRTAEAAAAAARADAEKYQTLVNYLKITAPFDGVVTRRNADPGALIQAGTASQSLPLVQLSDNYRLRLDFDVSVDRVKDMRIGDPVDVRVESLDGKVVSGVIARFARKVDASTRTMTTEIEVPNPQLELVPGMWARAVLKLDQRTNALTIPVQAITADNRSSVWIVNTNHEIEERAVTVGLETPDRYEVLSGLKEGDLIVIGNRTAARAGQKVDPRIIASAVMP